MPTRQEPQRYLKISEYIRAQIHSGELKEGDTLPSEAELCSRFNTSRGPVRQAMTALRGEGLISSGRGRRTVVLGDFRAEDFRTTYSVHHRYASLGVTLEQKILLLARRPAGPDIAPILKISADDPVVYLKRTRSFGGEVRIIQEHYFPLEVGRNILDYDESSGSLHELIHSRGIEYDNVDRMVEIEFAKAEDAALIGTELNHPLAQAFHIMNDRSGTPLEYSIFKWRAERMRLQLSTVNGTPSPVRVHLRPSSK